ncbi:hypothetical protein KY337_03295 [Candidatus Woesearchaeota archaeon]|nr:hypothetical protein [Candidatus Woesearchaeota archaeon]
MKKGIGGGLDILHTLIVIVIAILLATHGFGGNSIGPIMLIAISIIIITLEVIGLIG